MPVDPRLLELLHCPECRVRVLPTPDGNGLRCDRCRRVFPIRDEIPIMLLEEARREGEAD
ncbi:MAG: Trm112 family protein [Acidobacteria bacterium]|nr:Trm112 family protein [Acidobacteriota bacterium]